MIIFSGWRTLAALVVAGFLIGAGSAIGGGDNTRFAGLTIALVGVGLFLYGRAVNRPRPGFSSSTGEPVMLAGGNRLFFIPLQYWGVLLALSGVAAFVSPSWLADPAPEAGPTPALHLPQRALATPTRQPAPVATPDAASARREAITSAAQNTVSALNTLDSATLDAYLARVHVIATPQFADSVQADSRSLHATGTRHFTSTTDGLHGAVVSDDGQDATALVFADAALTTATGTTVRHLRGLVDLTDDDGTWRATGYRPLTADTTTPTATGGPSALAAAFTKQLLTTESQESPRTRAARLAGMVTPTLLTKLQNAPAGTATAQGSVLAVGLVALTDSRATLLVAADQHTVDAGQPAAVLENRMLLELTATGDSWKVSNVSSL